MRRARRRRTLRRSAGAPLARAGSITYDVSVDTTSYSGTTGSVQFTLIGGNSPVPLDTAAVSAFVPQAGLVPPPLTSGDVSGDLSTTMSMDNQAPSLYYESVTYGDSLTFQVTLTSTPGDMSAADTLFSFYLLDANGNPISSSASPSGEALDINIEGASGAFDAPVTYAPHRRQSQWWARPSRSRRASSCSASVS